MKGAAEFARRAAEDKRQSEEAAPCREPRGRRARGHVRRGRADRRSPLQLRRVSPRGASRARTYGRARAVVVGTLPGGGAPRAARPRERNTARSGRRHIAGPADQTVAPRSISECASVGSGAGNEPFVSATPRARSRSARSLGQTRRIRSDRHAFTAAERVTATAVEGRRGRHRAPACRGRLARMQARDPVQVACAAVVAEARPGSEDIRERGAR